MYDPNQDYELAAKQKSAHARPFLASVMLPRMVYCVGCGVPLNSAAWHVVDGLAFCPRCPNIAENSCQNVVRGLPKSGYLKYLQPSNGILWLSPHDSHLAGQSLWRIMMYMQSIDAGDYETANWFFVHPRVHDGPESADNTTVPTERPEPCPA